ncbi:hypothetical protein EVAR_102745_1 [Eumeta japonica]|uniref:Uncharacterized protein n=1 Tax=Eumeta variegata TaxID=151549 RepID=A0A4C1TIP6_EUMVA|nr:hypothetical protein EVAR_102745_1 [Eumeta japonica]
MRHRERRSGRFRAGRTGAPFRPTAYLFAARKEPVLSLSLALCPACPGFCAFATKKGGAPKQAQARTKADDVSLPGDHQNAGVRRPVPLQAVKLSATIGNEGGTGCGIESMQDRD